MATCRPRRSHTQVPSVLRPGATWVVAVLVLAAGCPRRLPDPPLRETEKPLEEAEPVGIFHSLQAGETLWGLATSYGVPVDELIEVNGIDHPQELQVGRLVFIPDIDRMAPQPDVTATAKAPPPAPQVNARSSATEAHLGWPVAEGVLYADFGVRNGIRHDGIDLGAPAGSPVLAAAAGEVVYVGHDRAFGNLVILHHADDLVTVYAHNQKVQVQIGSRVGAGEVIALVGQSGRAEGPHLHFEVREKSRPVDPLSLLPPE